MSPANDSAIKTSKQTLRQSVIVRMSGATPMPYLGSGQDHKTWKIAPNWREPHSRGASTTNVIRNEAVAPH